MEIIYTHEQKEIRISSNIPIPTKEGNYIYFIRLSSPILGNIPRYKNREQQIDHFHALKEHLKKL